MDKVPFNDTRGVVKNIPVYDGTYFQVHRGPSTIALTSDSLRPRGQADFPVKKGIVFDRTVRLATNVVALMPNVELRTYGSMGTCADVVFSASGSQSSGMRRWRSVKWTCLESRPINEAALTKVMRQNFYNYCQTHIDPLIAEQAWCSGNELNSRDVIGVRPCDLEVGGRGRYWWNSRNECCSLVLQECSLSFCKNWFYKCRSEMRARLVLSSHTFPFTFCVGGPCAGFSLKNWIANVEKRFYPRVATKLLSRL